MRRFSLLPSAITAFGFSCGLFVIFRTMVVEHEMSSFLALQSSTILILIAAFADVVDGAVARLIKAESDFGGEFDSLSDSVTFGVAPPLLMLKAFTVTGSRFLSFFFILSAMIFTLCGVLRLIRYNLARKNYKQDGMKQNKRIFVGLPIPAAAAILLSSGLLLYTPDLQVHAWVSPQNCVVLMASLMICIGYFMVSRITFPSLTLFSFRIISFYRILATGVFAACVLYGLLHYFPWLFFVLSWGYLVASLVFWLRRLLAEKRKLR